MRLLLTNDDGFDAEGLRALAEAAGGLGEIHVVAPNRAYSCMSHGVTQYDDVHVSTREVPGLGHCHIVDGTPADCVRIGLSAGVIPRPDVVLAGINHGGNLGVDIYYSGTIAAVREAAILGVPAIACSQYRVKDTPVDWSRAAVLARRVLPRLLEQPHEPGLHWSVNLPHYDGSDGDPPARVKRIGLAPLDVTFESGDTGPEGRPFRPAGVYRNRPVEPDSDVEHVFGGGIAVTPLGLNVIAAPLPQLDLSDI